VNLSSYGAAISCAALLSLAPAKAASDMAQRPTAPKPASPGKSGDSCGAQMNTQHLRATATPAVRAAIVSAIGHDRIRWIKPGAALTSDYRPDRLNIILDEAGTILTMRCG